MQSRGKHLEGLLIINRIIIEMHYYYYYCLYTRRQKIAILIRMQFLNDIIKSRHGFKTAQKIHKFRVFIKKTLNL